ncbi:hypothetical protein [Planotetraspora sp. GP83]|uniref:hypothetical protein n=1 Tax=Planotetraspora sp. GP83 TaxID=3156264 RepID=UPI0035131337
MTEPQTLTLDPTLDPWDKQPGESPKKYQQFVAYRDLGLTRTLTKAAETLTLSYGHVKNVASWNRWVERAAAWDAHLTEQYLAKLEEERRRAAEADAAILRAMTGMVGKALPHLRPETLTWGEFTRLAETTMRLRRQLYGDPTSTVAITGPAGDPLTVQVAEFAELPPAQRRTRLAELAAAVTRRVAALDDSDDDDEGPEGSAGLPG